MLVYTLIHAVFPNNNKYNNSNNSNVKIALLWGIPTFLWDAGNRRVLDKVLTLVNDHSHLTTPRLHRCHLVERTGCKQV